MVDLKVAIFGLGRSGLAVAKAVVALGGNATIYDQACLASLAKPEVFEDARALSVEVVLDWDGVLPAAETCPLFPQPPSPRGGEGGLLVVNPAVDMRNPILKNALKKGYEVVSEVEFAYRISKAPIVAITGTNGKSTTTVMTYLCLKECGIDAVLCGNIYGSGYPEVPLTEAALHSTQDQILVAEVSSFQLEWVKQFRPISAGITNITEDHLERYASFQEYAETKFRIFAAQKEDDFAVMRDIEFAKWPHVLGQKQSLNSKPAYMLTGDDTVQTSIKDGVLSVEGREISLSDLPFNEPHNLRNAQMAALLSHAALIRKGRADPERPMSECVIRGLKEFKGLAHRMERIGEKDGVRIVNNSMCTNVEAVVASVNSIGAPIHVLMGGKDKELDFSPLRSFFADSGYVGYVFGEAKEKLSEQIGTNLVYRTMEEAFRAALVAARTGETVMLAPGCASTDQFRDFRHRGDVFKKLAKEWLES